MARILVVDDEPAIRRLVRTALEERGDSILEAGDGNLGLKLAKLEQPDLILLDIALPQMSGLEVARHLREDAAISSIPVLFLTGLVPESERVEAAAGVIPKPFSPKLLAERVASALRGVSNAA